MPIIIKPSQLEESAKLGAQFRHCIHEEPEIGLYLPKTQEKIVEALKSFGIKEISTFRRCKRHRCSRRHRRQSSRKNDRTSSRFRRTSVRRENRRRMEQQSSDGDACLRT